jgi:histidinol dehydrogenase
LEAIRRRLSPRGEVVSARGRQRTVEAFGEPLSPRQVVERICADVESRGLAAVLEYSRKLDQADVDGANLRVPEEELERAHAAARSEYLAAVRRIRDAIRRFQDAILHRDVVLSEPDHELRLLYRPLARVGCCVPGGAAAYPSTLLMTVVPAQAAGVRDVAVVAPPTPFGADNPDLRAACWELGVRELHRVGGAQGVAALAYGIEGMAPVDKIVGPGNLFVALAKQHVSDRVGIDMIAGPTEVVVLADDSANAEYVAADLISQAEHAPGASILVTWSERLAEEVAGAVGRRLDGLARGAEAAESLETYGAIVLARDEAEACRISDEFAPEHLAIQTADPEGTLGRIRNAGAVFLGDYTPVAVGDYVAGPSHTLPTGGTARFASGLSANDFLKKTSVIRYTEEKLRAVADDLRLIAAKEGLTAHSASVDVRLG